MAEQADDDNVFHVHLDHCSQCRNHPFDLCHIGQLAAARQVEVGNHEMAQRHGLIMGPIIAPQPISDAERALFKVGLPHGRTGLIVAGMIGETEENKDLMQKVIDTLGGPMGDVLRTIDRL